MKAGWRVPVYLAGPSREAERVRVYAERLEATGAVRLTDSWWAGAEAWAGRDAEKTREEQKALAREHELSVLEARVLWVFWPKEVSHGAAYELGYARGYARGLGLTVVVSGVGCSGSIYTAQADFRDASDEVAWVEVMRLVGRMRGA